MGSARDRVGKQAGSAEEPTSRRGPSALEDLLRDLVDRCPAFIYLKDDRLRHIYANRWLLEKFGRTLSEFKGTTSSAFLPLEVVEQVERVDREALATRRMTAVTEYRVGLGGQSLWVRDVKFPVEGPDGKMAVAGVAFDVTARVRAEQALAEQLAFETLIAELSASLAATKADDLEPTIDLCLERLGRGLEVERTFFGRFSHDQSVLTLSHHWQAAGIEPPGSEILNANLAESFPWAAREIAAGRVVDVGPRLSRLPEEARALREQLERDGIRSGLLVPVRVAGKSLGFIGVDSVREEREYPPPIVERLRLVADVIGSTLVRTRAQVEAEQRLRFEGLLAELSRRFVGVGSNELEAEIERWLQPIARAIGVEHVALGALSTPDVSTSVTVLTWNAGRRVRPLRPEEAPWLVRELFERGRVARVESLNDLPREASVDRRAFESVGIRSFASVPLRCGDEVYGGMSLCSLSRERAWPETLLSWLGLVGEVFASALARRHAEHELRRALAEVERLKEQLEKENIYLRREIEAERGPDQIVGESPSLLRVLDEAGQVAATDSTVLILGETGTGKELLARFIHRNSNRAERPLVKVDCATLPATLVESELFGRERGAYTGAMSRQTGRFEIADGSTIFLDEIGNLPVETQVKLLRVLEEGAFERLGSSKPIQVDVRILAATNRDLQAEVAAGRFREDLFYRLNVFPLTMPPLRERRGDIPLLVWSFVREFAQSIGKFVDTIPRPTMSALERYPWHGNVRELRNVIERAMILCRGPVLEVKLPETPASESSGREETSLDGAQRRHILSILEQTGWRVRGKAGAAELLDMKPSTLENRMKKLGIRRPR